MSTILAAQGNSATQQAYGADGASSINLPDGIDLTDPESLIEFFQTQINQARDQLNSLVAEQQGRNDLQTKLGRVKADLAGIADGSGLKPGDPGWDQFVADAQDVLKDPNLDPNVADALNKALQQNPVNQKYCEVSNPSVAADQLKTEVSADKVPDGAIPAGTPPADATNVHYYVVGQVLTNSGMRPAYEVTYDTLGPAQGMDKDAVTKVKAGIDSEVDGLKNDSQIAMIRVQQYTDQISQLTTLLTNILKKLDDTAMAPINNTGH
ncbi:MAG: hypothetical protein FWD73_01905 [Polyangiaceae bacterium]|nr:hypothetical protein [Polyangiaceae bacterium]